MKLYETRTAPNPRRVRMFLAEKGLLDQVELVEIDLQKGDNLTPEFTAMNPMKKVPVLQLDDGTCIAETMAICRYFEEVFPQPPLLGRTPLEKAGIEQWLRWIDYYFMMPTGMCFQHTSGYFADRMTPVPAWGEECRTDIQKFLGFLDRHLEGREFIYGDQLTAADLNAFATVEFNKVNKIRVAPEQVHLQAWYERMKARPSAAV
ncbi:glutathione S-transferase family protein [Marinobacter sp. X15-166B]|uniref:glutathione S-transferase family protein n=1 Tax=Marinobacter sp. X15-166B TaxID=1897620 RepID=UPI00085CC6EF|nr:glutathione S-transferase family protein [Marinobacter sp. X15-166B]OEY65726.1 glutathione S-transferase [Marinobacter sp. X15-166B]